MDQRPLGRAVRAPFTAYQHPRGRQAQRSQHGQVSPPALRSNNAGRRRATVSEVQVEGHQLSMASYPSRARYSNGLGDRLVGIVHNFGETCLPSTYHF